MELNQCLLSHQFGSETSHVSQHRLQVALCYLKHEEHFREQKQLNPIVPEQVTHQSQSSVQ